jgi:hypothetical protein
MKLWYFCDIFVPLEFTISSFFYLDTLLFFIAVVIAICTFFLAFLLHCDQKMLWASSCTASTNGASSCAASTNVTENALGKQLRNKHQWSKQLFWLKATPCAACFSVTF